jgi:transposase
VIALERRLQQVEQENAELAARLDVRERLNKTLIAQLTQDNRTLEERCEDAERQRLALQTQADELRKALNEQIVNVARLQEEKQRVDEMAVLLREEIAWFKSQVYGRSSEKSSSEVSPDQAMLFNEPEVLAAIATALGDEEAAVITIEEHERRRKPGRKAIPPEFPRIELAPLDIPEAERVCPHDGTPLEVMGAETTERYHFVPPKLEVWVQKRLKRSCPCCHQGVKIAPVPPHILPKSMATPSLLAHITVTKFVDGLPLTRQSKQLERQKVNLGAGTMGLWMNTIGAQRLPPLINLMHEAILAEPVLHSDETPLQVLKSEKPVASDHYMIVRAAGPPGRRMVIFNYEPNRNVAALKRLLTGSEGPYAGKLVADGLGLYEIVEADPAFAFTLCGCLAHARRGFDRALKVSASPSDNTLANVAIRDYIGKVYAVEREITKRRESREKSGGTWSVDETRELRQQNAAPLMSAFKNWLDSHALSVPPSGALGKAIGYCLNQWTKLTRFLEHPEVPLDNNRVENEIRPFAVGRKAWLFCDTQLGAQASANLYSLAGTCRANGVDPFAYFEYLYEKLPLATTAAELEALLPWNVKALLRARAEARSGPSRN